MQLPMVHSTLHRQRPVCRCQAPSSETGSEEVWFLPNSGCGTINLAFPRHENVPGFFRLVSDQWPYHMALKPNLRTSEPHFGALFSTALSSTIISARAPFIEMADIPGFSTNITKETLIVSRRLHNQFPSDTPFPQIDVLSDGFKELCAIIAKYNVQNYFRLRLLHRHMTISEGQILLGNSIMEPLGYWTRPTAIIDIDLQNIHGHIFSVDATSCTSEGEMGNLFPSEFREGPPVSARNIDDNFFAEFTDCLMTRGLEKALGLEVIQDQAGKMIEFSFDIGSLLLQEEEVKAEVREERRGQFKLQDTGWTITVKDGTVYKTGETRCVTFPTGHIKVTDSKVECVSDAVKILKNEGVLAR
ncbi:hypothetical protein F5883DRAFT_562100 [Diaporthe sp. PMI_573]|nr:hypothetical protein F5883DRAFT_562100 [Diaporthaceae sp. PMI_573]